jgi:hypothetical protein
MTTSIAGINVPIDLAVIAARLPTLFLSDASRTERFWQFFAANIEIRIRAALTIRRRADPPVGAGSEDNSNSRQ